MSENKRRRSSSTGFWGRIRQSARHIENEAKEGARRVEHSAAEGARRVQHDAQERVRNMTPKQKNGWKKAGRIIGTLLLVFVLTASIFAGIFMAYINSAMRGKVEVYLDEFETQVSTELYYQDPDTQEWVMYQTLYMDENRIWVDLENIPKYLQDAAVAIEDKRFEKHHGVDWKGTTRAILYTLFGKNVQGGSTITQQLVKNVTGDNQVTVKRKITEIYRALELEKRYEKDEILEAYLNEVYFGQRCSGVMTAARVYFGKDVSELTLAECASMMGITNNPSMYDPFISSWTRENNRERQLTILSEMLSQGKIDQEEYDAAVAEDIQFANGFTISGKYVGSDGTGTEPDTEDTTDTSDDTASPADDSTPTIKGSNSWFTDAMITDVAEALVEKLGITEKVNSEGKKVAEAELAAEVYGIEPNIHVMHHIVKCQMASWRQGTQSAKGRSEVSGGGKKPWRQKGTGRARQGSIRAAQWRHGGVVFAPKPRSYAKRMNNKEVKLAMRSALSAKLADGELVLVDDYGFEKPSTKAAVAMLKALGLEGKRLTIIVRDEDVNAYLSFRNIPKTFIITADEANTYDLVNNNAVLMPADIAAHFGEVLA